MKDMTQAEIREFLLTGTRTGKLATVKANGDPHVVPIWFLLDGDDLVFNTWHTSIKAKNITRNGRVAISVDREEPPYDFVMIEGEATFNDDQDEVKKWATRIGGRYMGVDQAEAFGERNSVEGELLVRVKIEKIIAKKDLAAW